MRKSKHSLAMGKSGRTKTRARLYSNFFLLPFLFFSACQKELPEAQTQPRKEDSAQPQAPTGKAKNASPAQARAENTPSSLAQPGQKNKKARQTGATPLTHSCAQLSCEQFPDAHEALDYLAAEDRPIVIGFGEAHGRRGQKSVSTVQRFTKEILPLFQGHASSLTLELLMPPQGGCAPAKERAQATSQKITQGQKETNQNEYVALGHAALDHGITPDILRVSCAELSAATESEAPVASMMALVASQTAKALRLELEKNRTQNSPSSETQASTSLVLAYGGALHNDPQPSPEKRTWSYGPEMKEATGNRFTAIDLLVADQMLDTPTWQAMPWYDSALAARQQFTRGQVALIRLGEKSWTILWL
ncbi:MAG: hypothetical protein MK135_06320 [Polyangiaceae bacterium]|nr:hypothetical protein [Polyangiaceae bacterium]